ncbi:MAG: (2Fe-2S)-binding protein [Balneolaceae bacterium]|nr:MAG: (2Fe-2S)-binding protein [Balneolaceae bacterium]
MPIDRCICHKITFEELLHIAREKGLKTVEELQTENLGSTQCKLCEPYLRKMLETGQVSFPFGKY